MSGLPPVFALSDDFFLAFNNWRRQKEHEQEDTSPLSHGIYGVNALPAAVRAREVVASLLPGPETKIKSDSAYDPKQLAAGMKVEREHTSSRPLQKEIAKGHLNEFPGYYPALEEMEKRLSSVEKKGVVKLSGAVVAFMSAHRAKKRKEQQNFIRDKLRQGGAPEMPKLSARREFFELSPQEQLGYSYARTGRSEQGNLFRPHAEASMLSGRGQLPLDVEGLAMARPFSPETAGAGKEFLRNPITRAQFGGTPGAQGWMNAARMNKRQILRGANEAVANKNVGGAVNYLQHFGESPSILTSSAGVPGHVVDMFKKRFVPPPAMINPGIRAAGGLGAALGTVMRRVR